MPETRQLDPDDIARMEALQIDSRALNQVVKMQQAAAQQATADVMTRTAQFWTDIYKRYELVPGDHWRYDNGTLTKVEPEQPAAQPQPELPLQAAFTPPAPKRHAGAWCHPDGEIGCTSPRCPTCPDRDFPPNDAAGITAETAPAGQKPN